MDRINLSYLKGLKNLQYVKYYENNLICVLSDYDEKLFSRYYVYCNYCSISMIMYGELSVSINQKKHNLHEKDILFLGSTDFVKVLSISKDCKIMALFISLDFMNRILAYSTIFMNIWFKIKKITIPYISLNNRQFQIFANLLIAIMLNAEEKRENKDFWMINKIASIFLEISNMEVVKQMDAKYNKNNTYSIFQNFYILLSQYYKTERDIGFYANELNITPAYLSKVVKKSSPFTVQEQINRLLIISACHSLLYTNMTVQQIASDLNFSDSSSFIKFFKRDMHQTPIEYKKEQTSK
jgi:AraC family transcriptional activator of pobA